MESEKLFPEEMGLPAGLVQQPVQIAASHDLPLFVAPCGERSYNYHLVITQFGGDSVFKDEPKVGNECDAQNRA